MKHYIYPLISGVILFIAVCIPREVRAQCPTCPDGGGGMVSHLFVLDTTLSSNSMLTFPKFDPSIGTLTCITLHDTVSVMNVIGVRNKEPNPVLHVFTVNVSNSVTGPPTYTTELFRLGNDFQTYPPVVLTSFGTPGDSATLGPDTPFNKSTSISSITPNASYLGVGTVDLKFTIGGGVSSTGGLAFFQNVSTKAWGAFRLTYYWCPASALSTNIMNFFATRKGNTIQLQWNVNNEEKSNSYEIEISHDGRNFASVGKIAGQHVAEGSAAKYYYQYLLNQAVAGKLYLRIRQTDADGKVRYSAVRIVNLDVNGPPSFVIYPNPVSKKVSLQFDRILNGNFAVDIVNTTGQVLYQRTVKITSNNYLQLDLPNPSAPGIYYLRARDLADGQLFSSKLLISR